MCPGLLQRAQLVSTSVHTVQRSRSMFWRTLDTCREGFVTAAHGHGEALERTQRGSIEVGWTCGAAGRGCAGARMNLVWNVTPSPLLQPPARLRAPQADGGRDRRRAPDDQPSLRNHTSGVCGWAAVPPLPTQASPGTCASSGTLRMCAQPHAGLAGAAAPAGRHLSTHAQVQIPSKANGFGCVRALEEFLEARGLWGGSVDGLISCFYNPDVLPRRHREDLDRAGVEQVRLDGPQAHPRRL